MQNINIYNNNNKKYYYLLIYSYTIFVSILAIQIFIYSTKIPNSLFNISMLFIFLVALFNYIINNKQIKEGWNTNTSCFKLYKEYAETQKQIDQIDEDYTNLLEDIKVYLSGIDKRYINLEKDINYLLINLSGNLSNVVETKNAWNTQYITTLTGINNMSNVLNEIQNNTDPKQYLKSQVLIPIT